MRGSPHRPAFQRAAAAVIALALSGAGTALAANVTNFPTVQKKWNGLWGGEILTTGADPAPELGVTKDHAATVSRLNALLPPLNDEYKRKLSELSNNIDSAPINNCKPTLIMNPGFNGDEIVRVLVTPEITVLIYPNRIRHIYTDGRRHPPADELWPTSMGESIGHWEGETLFVETISSDAEVRIRVPGEVGGITRQVHLNLSENALIKERMRLVGDVLETTVTVVDPTSLVKPWERVLKDRRLPARTRWVESSCEVDRNPVIDGKITMLLK